ncbi:MAG TPA: hypothetical protein VJ036_04230 [bacterium]|nr:hypothetical protein [bacterium]
MRRNGFWGGLLAGGILGAMIGVASYSNLKPEIKNRITRTHQKIARAGTIISNIWRRLLKA